MVPLLRCARPGGADAAPAGIDVTKISKDPAVVAAYQADPLVHHGKPTLALALASSTSYAVLPERARDLRLPLLLQHGSADGSPTPPAAARWSTAVGTDDLTVRWYDGLWHEIYNEPERAQPLGDLREWLAARR